MLAHIDDSKGKQQKEKKHCIRRAFSSWKFKFTQFSSFFSRFFFVYVCTLIPLFGAFFFFACSSSTCWSSYILEWVDFWRFRKKNFYSCVPWFRWRLYFLLQLVENDSTTEFQSKFGIFARNAGSCRAYENDRSNLFRSKTPNFDWNFVVLPFSTLVLP